MNRALWKKAIGEAQWLLLFCALGLFLFCFLRVWLVTQVEMSRFAEIVGQLWEDIEKFSTVPLAHLLTYPGRIAVVYNEPIVMLLVTVWAVARGSDAVSGEISRGTMEMVLAQPTSRMQVLLSQAVVGVLGVAVLCSASLLGTMTGIVTFQVQEEPPAPSIRIPGLGFEVPIPLMPPAEKEPTYVPLSAKVSPRAFAPAALNLAALGVFLLAFTTLMSSWDRHRWRTIGIVSTAWVLMMMAKGFGMAVESVAWLQYFSFFTPYSPEWAVYVGLNHPEQMWRLSTIAGPGGQLLTPWGHNLILLSLAALCYAVAAVVFCNRDLPAPL